MNKKYTKLKTLNCSTLGETRVKSSFLFESEGGGVEEQNKQANKRMWNYVRQKLFRCYRQNLSTR